MHKKHVSVTLFLCAPLPRKHSAGSADHKEEPAAALGRAAGVSRLQEETRPASSDRPAHPAALILHTSSTQIKPPNSPPSYTHHRLPRHASIHTHPPHPPGAVVLWSCFPQCRWIADGLLRDERQQHHGLRAADFLFLQNEESVRSLYENKFYLLSNMRLRYFHSEKSDLKIFLWPRRETIKKLIDGLKFQCCTTEILHKY